MRIYCTAVVVKTAWIYVNVLLFTLREYIINISVQLVIQQHGTWVISLRNAGIIPVWRQTAFWSPPPPTRTHSPRTLHGSHICNRLSTTVPVNSEEVIEASSGFWLVEMSFLFLVRERACVWRGWRGKSSEELLHCCFLNAKRYFLSFTTYISWVCLTAKANLESTGSCKQVILTEWIEDLETKIACRLSNYNVCVPFPLGVTGFAHTPKLRRTCNFLEL